MPGRAHSKKIKDRFVRAIEALAKEKYPGKREVDILKALGFMPANYYRLRASDGNYPTLDHCCALCTKYSISAEWLIAGRGTMKYIHGKTLKGLQVLKHAVSLLEEELVQKKVQTKMK